jgi:hypothetical protein
LTAKGRVLFAAQVWLKAVGLDMVLDRQPDDGLGEVDLNTLAVRKG